MRESRLKLIVGLLVVVSHFLTVILTAVFFFAGGFLFEEMTTTIALVLPMFSIYTTSFLKYVVATRHPADTRSDIVTPAYAGLSMAFPILFFFSLIRVVILHAYSIGFTTFEQFKITVGLVEVVFGAYLGLMFSSMFETSTEAER